MTEPCSRFLPVAVLLLLPFSSGAVELAVPVGANPTVERISAFETFRAPVGPFDGEAVPKIHVEGEVVRRAWRVPARNLTPLQIMAPLRDQLKAQGYEIVFECAARDCGGFDFRFDVDVLPGPNMFVDISRFRYLTAVRGDPSDPKEAIGVLTSATAGASYLQIVNARVPERPAQPVAQVIAEAEGPFFERPVPKTEGGDLAVQLLSVGHVVLNDLDFASGTASLVSGSYLSLLSLSRFLADRPDLRIALVGHTDAVGGLEPNVALSRARARAVRSILIEEYGVAARRIDAEGMGYLSPIDSNLTETGRSRNRRVEAILLTD